MTYKAPENGWRTFLILWVTQSVSVFGSALTFFAINIWLVQVLYPLPEQKPQLAAAISGVALCFGLSAIVISPFAGAWADRHDRKLTMIWANLGSAAVSLLLGALLWTHTLQFWMLMLLTVAASALTAFHYASFDTSYSMLVPEHLLPRANGMMMTVQALSGILSPTIAAFLIAMPELLQHTGSFIGRMSDGTPLATAVDAVTFLLAGLALLFMQIPSPKRETQQKRIWADVKLGARYIWDRRPLLWLLGTFTMANLCGQMGVFTPLILRFNLAADWTAKGYTYATALARLNTITSLSGVLAGVAITTWGGLKKKRVYGVVVPMLVGAAAMIGFGLSSGFYMAAALAFVVTSHYPLVNAHSQAIWQSQVPRELQGRVFAVRRVIAQFSMPLGTAFAGWAGGHFNPGTVIAVLGAILLAFCIGQMFNPGLLRVEDKAALDQMAAKAAVSAD